MNEDNYLDEDDLNESELSANEDIVDDSPEQDSSEKEQPIEESISEPEPEPIVEPEPEPIVETEAPKVEAKSPQVDNASIVQKSQPGQPASSVNKYTRGAASYKGR